MQYPIPSDWDGQATKYYLVCWPNSEQWATLFRGMMTEPVRGRFWDATTGDIRGQQALYQQILDLNNYGGELMACNDIVEALEAIVDALANIQGTQVDIKIANQASASNSLELNANILLLARATALASAWSQSTVNNVTSIKILNQVSIAPGPISPTQPPLVEQEGDTGIKTIEYSDDNDEVCKRAYWLVQGGVLMAEALARFFAIRYLANWTIAAAAIPFLTQFVALEAGTVFLLTAGFLAEVAGILFQAYQDGELQETIDALVDFYEAEQHNLQCFLYNQYYQGFDTGTIQENLVTTFMTIPASGIPFPWQALVLSWFHLGNLALLYFESDLVTFPSHTYDCGDCGGT